MSLNSLLKFLTETTGIVVCLHDISGILANENLFADYKYRIHSSKFCEVAKTTRRGYNCAYGLRELAYPVVIDFEVKCIIYVGNTVQDINVTNKIIDHTCRLTGVDPQKLKTALKNCKRIDSSDILFELASVIESYILLLFILK